MSDEVKGRVAFAIMAVVIAACVMVLCGCVPVDDVEAEMLPEQTEHAPGMPLDAIEYDPPAWIQWCKRAYMVCDRTSGKQWWLLVMENRGMDVSYVVLPLDGAER